VYNEADASQAENGNIYAWQGADADDKWLLIGSLADMDAVYQRLAESELVAAETRTVADTASAAAESAVLKVDTLEVNLDVVRTSLSTTDARLANTAADVSAAKAAADKAQATADAAPDAAVEKVKALVGTSIAPLDGSGLVPSAYLPSYVDDVLELGAFREWVYGSDAYRLPSGTTTKGAGSAGCKVVYIELAAWADGVPSEVEGGIFLEDSSGDTAVWYSDWLGREYWCDSDNNGWSGKVYVCATDLKTYRWGGGRMVVIGSDLALGTTSATAFAGDRGLALEEWREKTQKLVDEIDGRIVGPLTQEEYDELEEINPNVYYYIVEDD
jgi:hypothetical protein